MYLAIIANSQTFAITRDYDFIIFEDLIALKQELVCFHVSLVFAIYNSSSYLVLRGTGIRGLMRGMATLPQGNQELTWRSSNFVSDQ